MENYSSEDQETCAPERACDAASVNFNESEISFDCPFLHPFPPVREARDRVKPAKPIQQSYLATFCVNCKSLYNPNLNSQFSCIYHKEKWSTSVYLCCGNREKLSPGCCKSKHIDHIIPETQKLCSNCRENGHLSKECPRDPNTRSGVDPQNELERINKLKTPKIQPKLNHVNYEIEKESFSDIEKLKAKIQGQNPIRNTNIFNRVG